MSGVWCDVCPGGRAGIGCWRLKKIIYNSLIILLSEGLFLPVLVVMCKVNVETINWRFPAETVLTAPASAAGCSCVNPG